VTVKLTEPEPLKLADPPCTLTAPLDELTDTETPLNPVYFGALPETETETVTDPDSPTFREEIPPPLTLSDCE
jgi:hypothetical protein